MKDVFVIAEIGCNHNGNMALAKEMIYKAKEAGAHAVKFQVFKAESLISRCAEKAEYQKKTTGKNETQLEMIKKLELSYDEYKELKCVAEEIGVEVFATPFDLESIDFLASIDQKIWKIPSGEITNLPYLEKINNLKIDDKKILLSTGMSTIGEIEEAIKILKDCEEIIILHCNTEYPTPDKDVNLYSIVAIQEYFKNYEVGFSDHSVGSIAAVGAIALGVNVIEKHFTLDKDMEGPDHKASANFEELEEICKNAHRIKAMLGHKKKEVTDSESKNLQVARKSIVAKETIKQGDIFTEKNITCKRPGNGISPMKWYDIIGTRAIRNFEIDELIEE